MQTRRTEYRNIGVAIAFISFCVVLLIYGVREELAVAGLVAYITYFIYRRPIKLIQGAIGLGFFVSWIWISIVSYRYAQENNISAWLAFLFSLLLVVFPTTVSNVLTGILDPFATKEWKRVKRQGAMPSLSPKELERLQKENRKMSLEETLEVMSDV